MEKQFSSQNYIFQEKTSPNELFSQLSNLIVILYLKSVNLTPSVSLLPYFYVCGSGSVF